MEQKTAMIIFQPSGRRGQVPRGCTIIEASRLLGVDIEAPCGEHQVCGKCKVLVEDGQFEKFGIRSVRIMRGRSKLVKKRFSLGMKSGKGTDLVVAQRCMETC